MCFWHISSFLDKANFEAPADKEPGEIPIVPKSEETDNDELEVASQLEELKERPLLTISRFLLVKN